MKNKKKAIIFVFGITAVMLFSQMHLHSIVSNKNTLYSSDDLIDSEKMTRNTNKLKSADYHVT